MELQFSTNIGSVLAMAELLAPCSPGLIGLQPFRFIRMDKTELRKLGAVIDSSSKREVGRSSASANRKSGLAQALSTAAL